MKVQSRFYPGDFQLLLVRETGRFVLYPGDSGLSGRVGMYEMERDITSGWSKEGDRHECGRRRRGACGGPFFDQCSTKAEQGKRNSKRSAYL